LTSSVDQSIHPLAAAASAESPSPTVTHPIPCVSRAAIGVALVAIVVRAIPAALAFGTSDVLAWDQLARLFLAGDNFYATQLHNWPVLWIYFTAAAEVLHDATALPFSFLVKLPPIAADAAIAVMLCRISPKIGLLYALNPVAILITGYHGQFDSMMLAPTVLAWCLWETSRGPRRLYGTALALGLGIWFKPVPLVLLPVFLPRLKNHFERAIFVVLAFAPAALGTLPYFLRWPEDVAANFFGYSSWFGQWGYPVVWMMVEYAVRGTVPWWMPDPDHVSVVLHVMYVAGRFVLLAALGFTWWWIYRQRASVLFGIVATFVAFYTVTVGFGVQYLLWVLPFALAARERFVWPFTFAATGLLIVAYSFGLAYRVVEPIPDNAPNSLEFIVKVASLPTWIVCGLWLQSLLRRARFFALTSAVNPDPQVRRGAPPAGRGGPHRV
jgi:hypothetical protein